jgi:hypothetical protein
MKYGVLAGLVLTTASHASIDLKANEQPLPVTVDQQAVAKIPKGYQFVEPGTLTVAISRSIHRRWRCWPAITARVSAATRISPGCWRAAWD